MKFYRPTWTEISTESIKHNLTQIKQFVSNTPVMAVVKTNAYGHGMNRLAQVLYDNGTRFFGVTCVEEGIQLRKLLGTKPGILILGSLYPFDDALTELIRYNLTPTISSIEGLEKLNQAGKHAGLQPAFHLKIDTGMGRIGISPGSTARFIIKLTDAHNVRLAGVYTHVSSGDSNPEYTKQQLACFAKTIKNLRQNNIIAHAANSSTLLNHKTSWYDMVRPGLCLYGLYPFKNSDKKIHLQPALSWKTRIVFLKHVPKGRYISYGCTYKTGRDTTIATVPVGYGDGYNRLLSNNWYMLVEGKKAKITGRVTMDMTMLDVTGIKNVKIGTETVIIGKSVDNQITAEQLAAACDTVCYEIVCNIHTRVPRIYT
jgi:alanine racemase